MIFRKLTKSYIPCYNIKYESLDRVFSGNAAAIPLDPRDPWNHHCNGVSWTPWLGSRKIAGSAGSNVWRAISSRWASFLHSNRSAGIAILLAGNRRKIAMAKEHCSFRESRDVIAVLGT